jgi:predicted cobalt transporter CbtA
MVRTFLVRGMLVGIVAGLLSFGFLKVYGEPQVDRAIAFETQLDEAKAAAEKDKGMAKGMAMSEKDGGMAKGMTMSEGEPELVSRPVQVGIGLFTAVVVHCAAFGGLFGLAFAFAYGRLPGSLNPQVVSALLAAAGFIAIYLVPNLKYPANPPSVGEPETIGMRTALYFIMIAISLAAMVGSVAFKSLFVPRFGDWNATLIVAACYIVLVALAGLLLPAVNEVPAEFPAVVLWKFRIASLGAQLIMWATIGLLFGGLTQRAFARGRLDA